MSIKLLVRQGGGAAAQPDIANLGGREGAPIFDDKTPLIEMGHRWEQGTASRGYFTSLDPEALLTYKFRPHASVKLIEDDSGSDVILAWHRIEGGNDVGRESNYTAGDAVKHINVQTMDANLDLRGIPFKNTWSRPAEDTWERLQALHAAKLNGSASTADIHRSTTNITVDRFSNGHLVDATSPVELEAKDYPAGTHVEEILTDIMGQWGKGWGITIHHDGGSHKCLLVQDYDDLAKFTSDLRISDQVADWDPTDLTAPVLEPIWRRAAGKTSDNSDTISGLISIYGGTNDDPRHLFVETGEAPEDWEVWVDSFHDDLAQNETQAERRAENILEDRKRPYITNQPSILLLPEQVTLITAGQAIEVKSVVMNQGADKHNWVWRRIAEVRWEPNYDGRWWAHLELDRPRNSRPASGAGQPKSTNPKPPPQEEPDDPGTALANWDFEGGGSGTLLDTVASLPAGFVLEEAASGNCPTGGGSWCAYNTAGNRYTDEIAVSASTDYVVSALLRWKEPPLNRNVSVIWKDSGHANIQVDIIVVGLGHTIGVTYPVSATVSSPVGAAFAVIDISPFSGLFVDNLNFSTVGTPADNDEFAIDYGECPHESPHYLPADWLVCKLDELATAIGEVSNETATEASIPLTPFGQQDTMRGFNLTKLGLVVERGGVGTWDEGIVESPNVFWDPKEGRYGMVYVGYDAAQDNGAIGLAWSDDLTTWTKDGSNPILEGTGVGGDPDEGGCSGPFIWYEDGTYHLYYIGLTATTYEGGDKTLCHATATDVNGSWTRQGVIIDVAGSGTDWRSGAIYHPNIVKRNATYYLFFNAARASDGKESIGYATSTDLFNWTVDDDNSPLLTAGAAASWEEWVVGDPYVFRAGETWYMAYYGATNSWALHQDGYAWTSDTDFPLGWTKFAGNPVLEVGTSGSFDDAAAGKPSIWVTGTALYHFYTADDGNLTDRNIALAVEYAPTGGPSGAAGGDLSGTYPNPSVVDDSHSHTAATLPASSSGIGEILISDTPSTPLVFADLIQNEAQDDLVYADP